MDNLNLAEVLEEVAVKAHVELPIVVEGESEAFFDGARQIPPLPVLVRPVSFPFPRISVRVSQSDQRDGSLVAAPCSHLHHLKHIRQHFDSDSILYLGDGVSMPGLQPQLLSLPLVPAVAQRAGHEGVRLVRLHHRVKQCLRLHGQRGEGDHLWDASCEVHCCLNGQTPLKSLV